MDSTSETGTLRSEQAAVWSFCCYRERHSSRWFNWVCLYLHTRWADLDETIKLVGDTNSFGLSLDINGGAVVVGDSIADGAVPFTGAVYVFGETGGEWIEEQKLIDENATSQSRLGSSVSIVGDTIVAGDNFLSNNIYRAYTRSGALWSETATFSPGNIEFVGRPSGGPVALGENLAVVGSRSADISGVDGAGTAWIFQKIDNNWLEVAQLLASDPQRNDFFGGAIAIDSDTIVTGANADDDNGEGSGSVYIFSLIDPPPTLISEYNINNTMADELGGPDLVPDGSGVLGPDGYSVPGHSSGLSLSGVLDPSNYSIEMIFRVDGITDPANCNFEFAVCSHKIIDFKDRSTDAGLYVISFDGDQASGGLQLYPIFTSDEGAFSFGTLHHIVLARSNRTDIFTIYLDGVELISATDSGSDGVFSEPFSIGHFLTDDLVIEDDPPLGFIDQIRIYDGPLAASAVADLVPDTDEDTEPDFRDNCPTVPNTDQLDLNGDGFGDACVSPDVVIPPGSDIGENPSIGTGTTIAGDTSIGDNVDIGDDVIIAKDLDIGDNVTVGDNSEIAKDGVIGNDVVIGENVFIAKDVQIGDGVQIGNDSIIKTGAVIGDNAMLGSGVTVGKNATIAADAIVPDGTSVPNGGTFP